MKDLTQGSITRHVVLMAVPIAAGMLFQTLYYLIDLYFVAWPGDSAIAGVGAAGNAQFIIMAVTLIPELETQVWILAHPDLREVARVAAVYAFLRTELGKLHASFAGEE